MKSYGNFSADLRRFCTLSMFEPPPKISKSEQASNEVFERVRTAVDAELKEASGTKSQGKLLPVSRQKLLGMCKDLNKAAAEYQKESDFCTTQAERVSAFIKDN